MNKLFFGLGVVILVGVLGYGIYENKNMMAQDSEKAAMLQKENVSENAEQIEVMKKEETSLTSEQSELTMKKEEAMKKNEAPVKSAGVYTAYSSDKLALAKSSKVVLFFHAAWCPTCRALDTEINSKGVKEGFTILKVDYDTSKELKAKYGVTIQHTLVQVDASGNAISKWSGGDLATIYSKAK